MFLDKSQLTIKPRDKHFGGKNGRTGTTFEEKIKKGTTSSSSSFDLTRLSDKNGANEKLRRFFSANRPTKGLQESEYSYETGKLRQKMTWILIMLCNFLWLETCYWLCYEKYQECRPNYMKCWPKLCNVVALVWLIVLIMELLPSTIDCDQTTEHICVFFVFNHITESVTWLEKVNYAD